MAASVSTPDLEQGVGVNESTPLVDAENGSRVERATRPLTGEHLREAAERLRETGGKSLQTVLAKTVELKNSMRSSPWLLSAVIGTCCLAMLSSGLFGIAGSILTLHCVDLVLSVYQVFFAVAALAQIVSVHVDLFGGRALLKRWMPFLEIHVGRGCFHVLTGGLNLATGATFTQRLPGLLLCAIGIAEAIWGVRCAMKIRSLMDTLNQEVIAVEGGQAAESLTASLSRLQRKFEAMDLNHDGKLSREELEISCNSVNLDLKPGELGIIFDILDPKGKGFIEIADLEAWWVGNRDMAAFLQV